MPVHEIQDFGDWEEVTPKSSAMAKDGGGVGGEPKTPPPLKGSYPDSCP